MSIQQAFMRQPVPPQIAQRLETTTIPAPTRGIIMDENEAYMQPGGAVVMDNWVPTMRGAKLRGGTIRWATLPETTPVISAFHYASGNNQQIYAGNATKLYNVTTTSPVLIQAGQHSGNYAASQMANQGGDYLIVVNDAGDPPLRYDGLSWEQLTSSYVPPGTKPSMITGPVGSAVEHGQNLVYVCKYRNRWFFIEASSMNAYYLPLNAAGGLLSLIPLSGAATKGGKLLFCASWSIDAGDGIDDKIVFGTDLGELLIFTGSDPSSASNWRQEGRYQVPAPMGMNAHMPLGGDMLIATVSGIVPISAAITKTTEGLELAAITRSIKPLWRNEVVAKRQWSWTMENWEEFGGIFVTLPGGTPGNRYCIAVNAATGAWCRLVGYDATCFVRLRGDMFFGTQDGYIMQCERTGSDNGTPYTATLVGGWEMFQSPGQTIAWRQARASFHAPSGQSFDPQIAACVDYVIDVPPAPSALPDPGILDVWDEGHWGPDMGGPPPPVPTTPQRAQYAQWDQSGPVKPAPVRNTLWVSVGETGFSHAPIVQVTIAQQVIPDVELIAISATFERCGINV